METATTIPDESYTGGRICCPRAEQWFKFVATRTGQYTICTTGDLDTVGTLYDCCGNLEAFPIDVWMKRAIDKYFGGNLDHTSLGRYAGIAQQYIFHKMRNIEEGKTNG